MFVTVCEALAAKRATEGYKYPSGKRNKKKNGRKTLFKQSMIEQTRDLVLMGYTHEKVAEFFGVSISSITKWKSMYKEFATVLNINRDDYDSKVVRSLYEIATGYDYVEKKKETEQPEFDGGKVKVKITKTKKHIPPNVGAIKVWLYNRRPSEFKPEPALSSQGGGEQPPAPPLNITYTVAAPVRAVKVTIGRDEDGDESR